MPSTAAKHRKACREYIEAFERKHNFLYCESCGRSNAFGFSCIRWPAPSHCDPKHPQLHNMKNLILLCGVCHSAFHAGERKEEFTRLEEERGLKELFS